MKNLIITYIFPLLLAATPLSLIIIKQFQKLFSTQHPNIGKTTTICTNITNTLTENVLYVRTIYFDKYKASIENTKSLVKIQNLDDNKKDLLVDKLQLQKDQVLNLMAITSNLCHHKKTKKIEDTIIEFFAQCGVNNHKIKEDYSIIDTIPSHQEKKLSTVVAIQNDTKEIFAFTKGHPSTLLKKCTKMILNGDKIPLDNNLKRKLRKKIKQLNKNGQKAIGLAYKPLPLKRHETYSEEFTENDITLIGIIGVTNPINETLNPTITLLKELNIKPYILTRVKERKAIAIGKILGLINPTYFESLTGDYLRQLSDQKLHKMLSNKEKDYIFAELKEDDKLRIIKVLKESGESVAKVRKEHKNGLKLAIDAIQKGRLVQENYPKLKDHSISSKLAQIILLLAAIILHAPLPLTILLILALELCINLPLEFALRVDKLKSVVIQKQKTSLKRPITHGLVIGAITSLIYFWSLTRFGWTIGGTLENEKAITISITMAFLLLAIIQILNAFSFKSQKKSLFRTNFLNNPYLLLTAILSGLFIYIFCVIPIFNLEKLNSAEWQVIIFVVFIYLLFNEIFKRYVTR